MLFRHREAPRCSGRHVTNVAREAAQYAGRTSSSPSPAAIVLARQRRHIIAARPRAPPRRSRSMLLVERALRGLERYVLREARAPQGEARDRNGWTPGPEDRQPRTGGRTGRRDAHRHRDGRRRHRRTGRSLLRARRRSTWHSSAARSSASGPRRERHEDPAKPAARRAIRGRRADEPVSRNRGTGAHAPSIALVNWSNHFAGARSCRLEARAFDVGEERPIVVV